jgi:dUTP pyrophosphatase
VLEVSIDLLFILTNFLFLIILNNFVNYILAGVIDPDFQGTIKVVLFNHGQNPVTISKTDRIAQLIVEKYCKSTPIYQTEIDGVEESAVVVIPYIIKERGARGLGSTGIK